MDAEFFLAALASGSPSGNGDKLWQTEWSCKIVVSAVLPSRWIGMVEDVGPSKAWYTLVVNVISIEGVLHQGILHIGLQGAELGLRVPSLRVLVDVLVPDVLVPSLRFRFHSF